MYSIWVAFCEKSTWWAFLPLKLESCRKRLAGTQPAIHGICKIAWTATIAIYNIKVVPWTKVRQISNLLGCFQRTEASGSTFISSSSKEISNDPPPELDSMQLLLFKLLMERLTIAGASSLTPRAAKLFPHKKSCWSIERGVIAIASILHPWVVMELRSRLSDTSEVTWCKDRQSVSTPVSPMSFLFNPSCCNICIRDKHGAKTRIPSEPSDSPLKQPRSK